jgi:hypothetical protein
MNRPRSSQNLGIPFKKIGKSPKRRAKNEDRIGQNSKKIDEMFGDKRKKEALEMDDLIKQKKGLNLPLITCCI